MSTNLQELLFRHCLHCLLEPGGNGVDSFRFRMFVDPLLEFSSRKVGLLLLLAIIDNVARHSMPLLENTPAPAGKFDLRMFAVEDSSGILRYRFELHLLDS